MASFPAEISFNDNVMFLRPVQSLDIVPDLDVKIRRK
jgi:hypothetical protein